jgi:hypothetical protein
MIAHHPIGLGLVTISALWAGSVSAASLTVQVQSISQDLLLTPARPVALKQSARPHRSAADRAESDQPDRPTQAMAAEILEAHNQYRRQVAVPDLVWSEELAQDAQRWSDQLAAMGGQQLEHSQDRNDQGENLWMGTSGYYSPTDMVKGWGAEIQYFRMGNFPDVSTTGNWTDVGHYTQMVWRNTTEVGCAKASAGGNDILTCRYRSPGNYQGERPY